MGKQPNKLYFNTFLSKKKAFLFTILNFCGIIYKRNLILVDYTNEIIVNFTPTQGDSLAIH